MPAVLIAPKAFARRIVALSTCLPFAVSLAAFGVVPAAALARTSARAATAANPATPATAPTPAGSPGAPGKADPRDRVRLVARLTSPRSASAVLHTLRTLGTDSPGAPVAPAGRAVSAASTLGRFVGFTVPAADETRLRVALTARPDVASVARAHLRTMDLVPDDPQWPAQARYFDAVRAPSAWNISKGSPALKIAVVDSGVDVSHPDLVGRIAGRYNAVTGGTDVTDVEGHGTSVASVAAARADDGTGVAGAAYDTSILAVRVEDDFGQIWSDAVANGVVWAADHGADVINLSLGSPSSDSIERDAIGYANRKGVLVVASAGNDGDTTQTFPAADPGVLAVGSTSADGRTRAPFSNFGAWVDVAAPGVNIRAAMAGGGWTSLTGTSFSAPLVSGEAALLLGRSARLSGTQLASAITASARSGPSGFAHGLVDFRAALERLGPTSRPTLDGPPPGSAATGLLAVHASSTAPRVRFALPGAAVEVPVVAGTASATLPTWGLSGPVPLTAADCGLLVCDSTPATRTVLVHNPPPLLAAPADGALVTAAAFLAGARAAGGAVAFTFDGRRILLDATAPYSAPIAVGTAANGSHSVRAYLCNSSGTICDSAHPSAARNVTVRRLHPQLAPITPAAFSPNGDRRADVAEVRFRLEQAQAVTLRITNAAGQGVLNRSLGLLGAGTHRLVWNGRSATGAVVRSGTYRLALATRKDVGALHLSGASVRSVIVDLARPAIGGGFARPTTVFPYPDGFRDTTSVRLTVSEPVAGLQLRIYDVAGRLVRLITSGSRPRGGAVLVWNGRRASGTPLPAGSYFYRIEAVDRAGNETVSARHVVRVSSARI